MLIIILKKAIILLPIKSPLTVKENNGSHPCGEDINHKAQPLSMWRYINELSRGYGGYLWPPRLEKNGRITHPTLLLPTRMIHMMSCRHEDWGTRSLDIQYLNLVCTHRPTFPTIKRSRAYLAYQRKTVKKQKTAEYSTVNVKRLHISPSLRAAHTRPKAIIRKWIGRDFQKSPRRPRYHQACQKIIDASSASIDDQIRKRKVTRSERFPSVAATSLWCANGRPVEVNTYTWYPTVDAPQERSPLSFLSRQSASRPLLPFRHLVKGNNPTAEI